MSSFLRWWKGLNWSELFHDTEEKASQKVQKLKNPDLEVSSVKSQKKYFWSPPQKQYYDWSMDVTLKETCNSFCKNCPKKMNFEKNVQKIDISHKTQRTLCDPNQKRKNNLKPESPYYANSKPSVFQACLLQQETIFNKKTFKLADYFEVSLLTKRRWKHYVTWWQLNCKW